LHHLRLLELLGERYATVFVPPAVAAELAHPRAGFVPVRVEEYACFRIQAPADKERVRNLSLELDPGESEAIALALEIHADYLLIDELDGRTQAQHWGIQTTGVLAILLRAKETGRIGLIAPLLDELERGLRFFVSRALRENVLKHAGEG
jgi:hypothetical protein